MTGTALQPREPNSVDPAGLPAGELQSPYKEAVADLLAKGMGPAAIAKKLHPNDRRARAKLRKKLWKMVRRDAELAVKVAERAHGELLVHLVPMTRSLAQRAIATGKPDAVKLAMEVAGFHTPKQAHEHSGEIKIKVDMPRPANANAQEDVVDAEVVED